MSGFTLRSWNGRGVQEALADAAQRALDETTASAALRAQVAAPRDTGFMANTVTFQPARREGQRLVGRFGNWEADYTLWNEIGTSRMPARPFLRPAADAEFPLLAQRIKEQMR